MPKIILAANTDWYLFNFRKSLMYDLYSKGMEVVLVSPPGPFKDAFQDWGFRWISWKEGRKTLSPLQELVSIVELARIYFRERPDLLHHHTIKPVLYGTLAARFSRVPAVINAVTGRGFVFLGDDQQSRFLRFFISPLYRFLLKSSRVGVIFENQADRDFFVGQRLVRSEQTWLIESVGVDPDRFKPQPEPEGKIVILLPARMLWDKGVEVLVQAARLLKLWQVPARVILAGPLDPGNPSAIPEETILEWQDEGVLEWVGWQENMEMVYSQSHIVTLPSFHEGVPTVLIEAAACGRPVVATDIPGCRAVITSEENGILVPPRDAQALANALVRLVRSPNLRQRMGKAARQRVLDKFTYQRVNADTYNVYQHFLG